MSNPNRNPKIMSKENILQIPPTTQGSGGSEIPAWIKDNAGWWQKVKFQMTILSTVLIIW